jgi:hypothetical protein
VGSPKNLKRWGLAGDDKCILCGAGGSGVAHVLSGCKVSLHGGRCRKRHDAILKVLVHEIQVEINKIKNQKSTTAPKPKWPVFVKEGSEKEVPKGREQTGFLDSIKDWEMLVDLEKQLKFPQWIFSTKLRPDMVLYSTSKKILVIIELTCPSEENIELRHAEKTAKYEDLEMECRKNGWKTRFFAVEVGARGCGRVHASVLE